LITDRTVTLVDSRAPQEPPTAPDGTDVVRYAVHQFLDPGGQFGLTIAATWSCATCNTLVRCKGVADAVHTLRNHAIQHHHRGADQVIP
jgi:hypothetical protein